MCLLEKSRGRCRKIRQKTRDDNPVECVSCAKIKSVDGLPKATKRIKIKHCPNVNAFFLGTVVGEMSDYSGLSFFDVGVGLRLPPGFFG